MGTDNNTSDGLSAADMVAALAALGVERRYKKGAVLIHEGDVGDLLFIVRSGRLRAFSHNPSTDKEITHGVYGEGDYVGEMSLDGGPRSASVEALHASVCSVITRSTLLGFIAQHPEFAFVLLSRVIARARAATLSAKKMATLDVHGRLIDWLDAQAGPPEPSTGLRALPTTTHAEIAQLIGASREMVSRSLKELERGGQIHKVSRQTFITKSLIPSW
jgi:CRP/FNR family transcriptional regulator, cyclic AMP receptor protein